MMLLIVMLLLLLALLGYERAANEDCVTHRVNLSHMCTSITATTPTISSRPATATSASSSAFICI